MLTVSDRIPLCQNHKQDAHPICTLHIGVAAENGRIVGGEDAPDNTYPYQVSLQVRMPNMVASVWRRVRWAHNCGGSIVTRRHVVTAAHCLGFPASDLSVWAGTTRLNGNGQRLQVASYVIHPEYVVVNTSDIAIVETVRPFRFRDSRVSFN